MVEMRIHVSFQSPRRIFGGVALAIALSWLAGCASLVRPSAGPEEPPFTVDILSAPVSATDGSAFQIWGERLSERDWNHYECAAVAEHSGTAICLFAHSMLMRQIFASAVWDVEGPRGGNRRDGSILGIDLRHRDLEAFAERRCMDAVSNHYVCNPAERAFLFAVMPRLEAELGAQSVIAAPWGNMGIIEHELLHAQYFSDEAYRDAVTQFWHKSLNSKQRNAFRSQLHGLYDSSNEDLMINEFQAYMAQSRDVDWLTEFRARHREGLIEALAAKGLRPNLMTFRSEGQGRH